MTPSAQIVDRFRSGLSLTSLGRRLKELKLTRPLRLMEVCGTHTVSIFRHGIRSLLPEGAEMLSGPGCPVCVTPDTYIDTALALGQEPEVMLATFGDMVRVPGSKISLAEDKLASRALQIIYSQNDALQLARNNPQRKIIFLSVGFETTTPGTALMLRQAAREGLENLFVLPANKLIPPAMRALMQNGRSKVDGFLLPAHVSTIIGLEPYRFLPGEFNLPGVVAGFEPLDLLYGIYRLVSQLSQGQAGLENAYTRIARDEGNPAARQVVDEVFQTADTAWRGLGVIPRSGLVLSKAYEHLDASRHCKIELAKVKKETACRCGEVLQGIISPQACQLFGTTCLPHRPVGPCMVSREGTCAAHYKYGDRSKDKGAAN